MVPGIESIIKSMGENTSSCLQAVISAHKIGIYKERFDWHGTCRSDDMAKTKTKLYDAAEYLETEEDMAAYLQAAFDEGEPALVIHALGNIARARGMSQIARQTGLRRESLYKALSPEGNPEFATVMKVVRALGIELHAEPTHVR